MISQDQLIPTLILLLKQFQSSEQKHLKIAALLDHEEKWNIQWSDQTSAPYDNVQSIFSQILALYNPLCSTSMPREVLVTHLGMLGSEVPVDLLPILQNVFASPTYGYCSNVDTLIDKLGQAQVRSELRNSPSTRSYNWQLGYDTHIGMRKAQMGQTNQDYFFLALDESNAFIMVADGISYSTAGSGNMASHIATQVINHFWNTEKELLRNASREDILSFLKTALFNANIYICDTAKRLAEEAKSKIEEEVPMGTTIVLAYIQNDEVTLAHLGDSRAYLITEEGPALITGDHNIRGERIKHGLETEYESGAALTRYLGYFNEKLEPSLPKIEPYYFRMLPNEKLLLCSDGLNDYAAPNHFEMCGLISKALEEEQTLTEACWALTRYANLGGGGDNVTTIVAQLQHPI